jgi:hypothetical protein
MIKKVQSLLGLALGSLALVPITSSAALVEYSGASSVVINGVEQNVSLSLTIDDNFHMSHSNVQHMYDNYPASAAIDAYYGYFDIHDSALSIEGTSPVTGSSGKFYIWVTDSLNNGGDHTHDTSALRLETEDVVTEWSDHSRIEFLDQEAEPYDWSTWWGDTPSNELPPVLGVRTLDFRHPDGGGHVYLGDDTLLLRPVPVPAAIWLFGSGLLGFLSLQRRKKGHS